MPPRRVPGTIPLRSLRQPVLTTDTVVVGAGIVGVAMARALAAKVQEVVLLDRGPHQGTATSSRNSGVLHAGLYYPPHSLKAQLCVRGKKLAYEYLKKRSIPYRKCGKLIVATRGKNNNIKNQEEDPLAALHQLHQQAQANGVMDTKILSKEETLAREPSLSHESLQGALYSPSTGIVDSHAWMEELWNDANDKENVTTSFHTEVVDAGVGRDESGNKNETRIGLQLNEGNHNLWLSCRSVINCAGLEAPALATMIHRNAPARKWKPPRHYYAKGHYYRVTGVPQQPDFTHLVYPLPEEGGLGIHATMDLQGQMRFGPDVEWIDPLVTDANAIDYQFPAECPQHFYDSIQRYWKEELPHGSLVPDYTGIRPKLSHPSLPNHSSFQDFMIAGPETHGIKGLVHLFGIESPGLTSSMALAEYVAGMIEGNKTNTTPSTHDDD